MSLLDEGTTWRRLTAIANVQPKKKKNFASSERRLKSHFGVEAAATRGVTIFDHTRGFSREFTLTLASGPRRVPSIAE